MKKVKVTLPTKGWGSLNTKYRPYALQVGDDELTDGTQNVVSDASGALSKRGGGIDYNSVALSAAIEDQHEAVFSDGTRYLLGMAGGTLSASTGGGTFVSVAAGYSATGNMEFATYNDRVYFGNGIDTPQVADRTTAYGGITYLPVTFTVSAFASLAGDSVTIGSSTFTEGVNWTAATDNPTTAESLRAAIDAHADYIATRSGSVVTVRPVKYAVKASTTDATNLAMAAVTALRVRAHGAQAPTAALTSAVGAGGNVVAGSYFYKVTFLYYDAEESNGGTISSVVSPGVSSQITLTDIPLGGYGVTARKIYRDDNTGVFRLVATIADNTTTSTSDNTATGTTLIPTVNNVPPVYGLIIQLKDRLWLGQISGEKSRLYRTEAAQPNIVRPTNFTLCDSRDPITALMPFNGRPVVFNRASFGQILGETSEAYRYDRVSGPVGCVDNRSIQERTIRGVPTLVWLADENLYQWNGATVDVISDKIENIVQANIQQAQQVQGSHTDTTQTDFVAGTASGGITLSAVPGTVTTPNPTRVWQTEADWEGGVLTNVVSNDVANVIKVPIKFAPAYSGGTLSGSMQVSGSNMTLPAVADNTGATWASAGDVSITSPGVGSCGAFAHKLILTRAGTLTSLTFRFNVIDFGSPGDGRFVFSVWADSFGAPGSILGSSPESSVGSSPNPIADRPSGAMSVALAAGTYWVGVRGTTTDIAFSQVGTSAATSGAQGVTGRGVNTPWSVISPALGLSGGYTFVQTAVPASGQYVSETYDTMSGNIDGTLTLTHAGTYPAFTTGTTRLDASVNGTTWVTNILSTANQNGAQTVAVAAASTYRYVRIRVMVTTSDDRNVPIIEPFTLKFATTAVWVSEEIDCTADVTAYEALTATSVTPTGTSVTVEAASSATSGAGYSSFAALGSTTVRRYFKAKLTITADTADELTAAVSSLRFNYRIVANFISAAIDTSTTPAGWDVFQAVVAANGGTILLELRTAASSGTLGAASWSTVTNGAFPANTALQFAQWRATITSTAGMVPTLESVTLNWFISTVASIRAASLFHNKSYYLSVAEFGYTVNNIIIELDGDNKWRVHRGIAAATMGLFFNDPYYGSATDGVFVSWLTASTERGANIAMVIKTKAFDFGDLTKRKVQGNFTVSGKRTGATFAVSYTPDAGATYYPFVDSTGATTFTIAESADPTPFIKRLRPRSADVYTGATLGYKIESSDSHEAEINEVRTEVLVREGSIIDV